MKFTFIPSDKAFIGLPPIIQAFLTLPANLGYIIRKNCDSIVYKFLQ